MNEPATQLSGLLAIDKPAGITSARAVERVKRLLPRGTKVGHAGTLDSFATGLLVLLIGKATRQCEAVMGQRKTYEATIKLGAITETDDPESAEQPFVPRETPATQHAVPARRADDLSFDEVDRGLQTFVGEIMQRPPAYSALKVQGVRAADRVRAGESIALAPRPVTVYAARLVAWDAPLARVVIDCGRGTYIRAIARDLGELLGVGGFLTELRRTRTGSMEVSAALRLDALSRDNLIVSLQPATA